VKQRVVAVFIALLACASAQAQQAAPPSSDFDALKQKYQAALNPIEQRTEEKKANLRKDYVVALDKAQKDAMAAGDLDAALAAKSERERLVGNEETTDEQKSAMPRALAAARAGYEKGLSGVASEAKAETQQVLERYLVNLQALEKSLTMRGDIEGALAVRAERERTAPLRGAPASRVLSPPANLVRDMQPVNQCEKQVKAGFVMLTAPHRDMTYIQSAAKFRPPFALKVKARTDSTNIRIYYGSGMLIFNWEAVQQELRVHDPKTGAALGIKGKGYVSPAKWHDVAWEIRPDRQRVLVDGEVRYEGAGDYAELEAPVAIGPAWGSTVLVESLFVEPLKP
jgi:hypothetical protein